MIRMLAAWVMLRSIDRGRGVPRVVRAAMMWSASLRELERRLRDVDAELRGSTAGLVEAPPAWLAARTVSRLEGRGMGRRYVGERNWWKILAFGGAAGVVVGAVIVAGVVMAVDEGAGDGPVVAGAGGSEEEGAGRLVMAMLGTGERVASAADPITGPLLAEARRLREDTEAAAGFLLDRLRVVGVVRER